MLKKTLKPNIRAALAATIIQGLFIAIFIPDTLLPVMLLVILGGIVLSLVIFILLAESFTDDNIYTEAVTPGEVDSLEDLDDDNRLGFVRKRSRRNHNANR